MVKFIQIFAGWWVKCFLKGLFQIFCEIGSEKGFNIVPTGQGNASGIFSVVWQWW
jgi:hypothetical protein